MNLDVETLSRLLAMKFIARPDVYATQFSSGGYTPTHQKITKAVLAGHLDKTTTVGHYMLNTQNQAKLMAFDVDLQKCGYLPTMIFNYDAFAKMSDSEQDNYIKEWENSFRFVFDLRAAWQDRQNLPGRQYIKRQMRELAGMFASPINSILTIDTAVAYTGNKGIHVYGFTGLMAAGEIREAAQIVVDSIPFLQPLKGKSFFSDARLRLSGGDDETRKREGEEMLEHFNPAFYSNFHVEMFPKQAEVQPDRLGNLMRLPLGRNLHSPKDPTFFLDMTGPLSEFTPADAVWSLTTSNPYEAQQSA